MSDSINVYFDDGTPHAVCFYSHWGASHIDSELKSSIYYAYNRWNDPEYCTRIIISQLLSADIYGETGFGIRAVAAGNYREKHRVVYYPTQTVIVNGQHIKFDDYVNLKG